MSNMTIGAPAVFRRTDERDDDSTVDHRVRSDRAREPHMPMETEYARNPPTHTMWGATPPPLDERNDP